MSHDIRENQFTVLVRLKPDFTYKHVSPTGIVLKTVTESHLNFIIQSIIRMSESHLGHLKA